MAASIVREGIVDDIDAVIPLARESFSHSIYDDEFDEESVRILLNESVNQGLFAVLENSEIIGFACGVSSCLSVNHSVKVGAEIALWVGEANRGKGGIKLMRKLEELAKNAGIKYWNMGLMGSYKSDDMEKLYKSLGYFKNEITYTKVL